MLNSSLFLRSSIYKSSQTCQWKLLAVCRLPSAGATLSVNIYATVQRTKAANERAGLFPAQWWHFCCETEARWDTHKWGQRDCPGLKPAAGDVNTQRGRIPFRAFTRSSHACFLLPSLVPWPPEHPSKKCFQKVKGQTVVIKGSTVTAGKIMWPQCQSQLADILGASLCSSGCACSAVMCDSKQDAFY